MSLAGSSRVFFLTGKLHPADIGLHWVISGLVCIDDVLIKISLLVGIWMWYVKTLWFDVIEHFDFSLVDSRTITRCISKIFPHRGACGFVWFDVTFMRFNSSSQDKIATTLADDIFKWIFLNEMVEFRIEFQSYLSARVQLAITQHCFR